MQDLYEKEVEAIYAAVQTVQHKYYGKANTSENLALMHNELVGRLEDLGFQANVDVTPTLAGQPVSVSIEGRIDKDPFDAERKRWEVKKRITEKRDSRADDIEGVV